MNDKFQDYKQLVNKRVVEAQAMGVKINTKYDFVDSIVQERMMRLGIESRLFRPDNNNELYEIAVLSLIHDDANNAFTLV